VRKEVAGRSVNAYDLPAVVLAELEAEPADLVFIDGPGMAGGRFSRWALLHTVLPLLPDGFRFYLDDALSDSALEYARLWAELPRVEIAGVGRVAGTGRSDGYRARFRPGLLCRSRRTRIDPADGQPPGQLIQRSISSTR
jgi:hypothetical protein